MPPLTTSKKSSRSLSRRATTSCQPEPLCLLLAKAGLTTPTDAITLCIQEIGDGRLGARDATLEGTFVAQLARDASTASGQRTATTSASPGAATRRRRHRRRSGPVA